MSNCWIPKQYALSTYEAVKFWVLIVLFSAAAKNIVHTVHMSRNSYHRHFQQR